MTLGSTEQRAGGGEPGEVDVCPTGLSVSLSAQQSRRIEVNQSKDRKDVLSGLETAAQREREEAEMKRWRPPLGEK